MQMVKKLSRFHSSWMLRGVSLVVNVVVSFTLPITNTPPHLRTFPTDFNIVSAFCDEAQLQDLFVVLVNSVEEEDSKSEDYEQDLHAEEFSELLVRLAVRYVPGDHRFTGEPQELRESPE